MFALVHRSPYKFVLSRIDPKMFNDFLKEFGIDRWPHNCIDSGGNSKADIEPFKWNRTVAESSKSHMKKVTNYLKIHFKNYLPPNIVIRDVSSIKNLLELNNQELNLEIRGGTDLIFVKKDFVQSRIIAGIHGTVELKKGDLNGDDKIRKDTMEMIAADFRANSDIKVFGVLTNLKTWKIYWMEKDPKKIRSICFKHRLKAVGQMLQNDDFSFPGLERIHRVKFCDLLK